MPKVKWGDTDTINVWRTKYLDSMFEAGGGCMTDVKIRDNKTTLWQDAAHNTFGLTDGYISTSD